MGAGEYVSVRSQRELLEASTPSPDTGHILADLNVDANELSLRRSRGMSPEEAGTRADEVLPAPTASTLPPRARRTNVTKRSAPAWEPRSPVSASSPP